MAKTSSDEKFNPTICHNIQGFQEYLKRLRTKDIEQNISNCTRFHNQLKEAYETRNKLIQSCLSDADTKLNALKETKKQNESDIRVQKELRREQTRQRMIQKELTVEEIIQDRSLKALQERCRQYVNF